MKNIKGVTLISLVITIIILLILAGVVVVVVFGEDGFLRVNEGKFKAGVSTVKEQFALELADKKVGAIVKKSGGTEEQVNVYVSQNDIKDKVPEGYIKEDKGLIIIQNVITYYSDNTMFSKQEKQWLEDMGIYGVSDPNNIEEIPEGTSLAMPGSGTQNDPYLLQCIEHLVEFSEKVTNGTYEQQELIYVNLERSLDFNSDKSYLNVANKEQTKKAFKPIGREITINDILTLFNNDFNAEDINFTNSFRGVLDGQNYSIMNMSTNHGLFTFVDENSTIKNLNVKGLNIVNGSTYNFEGEEMTILVDGGIAAISKGVTIDNCSVSGTLNSNDIISLVGGIVGTNSGGIISNSFSEVTIDAIESGESIVGGIASSVEGSLINCYNSGHIIGVEIGGLAYNLSGDIIQSYNEGNLDSEGSASGLVVNFAGNINQSYNTGKITVRSEASGLVGNSRGQSDTIKNSYNMGDITAKNGQIAGIVIDIQNGMEIQDCYNNGTMKENGGNITASGILGRGPAKIINCINRGDINASNVNGIANSIYSYNSEHEVKILNCKNEGNLLGDNISGIVSAIGSSAIVDTCINAGSITARKDIDENEPGMGTSYLYGIASNNSGTIINCYNTKNFVGYYTAGIVGNNSGIVEKCYNTGNLGLEKSHVAAGIAYNNNGTITQCYNTGNLGKIPSNFNVSMFSGGIAIFDYGTIEQCYNTGNLEGTNASGIVASGGKNIKNCYNSGNIKIKDDESKWGESDRKSIDAGGICTHNMSGTVENCYNLGKIEAKYAGGIVGSSNSSVGYGETIINCHNIGTISGEYSGGIFGYIRDIAAVTIANCFYVESGSLTAISNESDVSGTQKKTVNEMPEILTIINQGLNQAIFKIEEGKNAGNPILIWQ